MPPRTVWEWLEAYGAIETAPEKIFGEWRDAVKTVTAWADDTLPEKDLDAMLDATRDRLAKQPGELRFKGLGFAALEERRAGRKLAPQLDFGEPGEDQREWSGLLETGRFDDAPPRSYQVDPDWLEPLNKAPESWKRDYHLAIMYIRQKDWERATEYAGNALRLKRNAWTLHLAGNVTLLSGGKLETALTFLRMAALAPEADAYLVKEVLKQFVQYEKYAETVALYEALPELHRRRPMAKLQYACGLAHTGRVDEAEKILVGNGGLELPDAREGIVDITKLFFWIKEQQGVPADRIRMPEAIDYRTK